MGPRVIVLISLAVICAAYFRSVKAATNLTFPSNFKWGVATASYQIEGAWNEDGKAENIWDHITHTNPTFIDDQSNGDIACDSYHKYKEDVALLKELGVNFYRFSLSWSRILPGAFKGTPVNPAGIRYYRNLIKELRANGIEPMVTLYHWDLPQSLQELGGWVNPSLQHHFAYYATVVFMELGDLVKEWTTFNEPKQTCQAGYGNGEMAPGIKSSGLDEYKCAHTLLKAHARAYRIYDTLFRRIQRGRVGIVIDSPWFEPASNTPKDIEAAERTRQFIFGWYANPILKGDYPQVMIDRIAARSRLEGHSESRLPRFSAWEKQFIKGTYDFLGVNAYTSIMIYWMDDLPISEPKFLFDMGTYGYQDATWEDSGSPWLKVVPWGLGKLVTWIKNTYNNPEIVITENGVSDKGGLDDQKRIEYYREYLSSLLEAMLNNGVRVTGYTAWSLLDNFEWARGYTEKFGLVRVNFNDPNRERTKKASFSYYKDVVRTNCLVDVCQ